jgi:hypothetical protein
VQITTLAKCDQTFNHRAQLLCLWQGCDDLLVFDQRLSHIPEQHLAVL